jgi:hypothetical protein
MGLPRRSLPVEPSAAAFLFATLFSPATHALQPTPPAAQFCRSNLVVVATVKSITVDSAHNGRIPNLVHADVEALIHGSRAVDVTFAVTGSPWMSPEDPPTAVGTRLLLFLYAPTPWPDPLTAAPYNGPLLNQWQHLDASAALPAASMLQANWNARCNPPPSDTDRTPYMRDWFPSLRNAPRK